MNEKRVTHIYLPALVAAFTFAGQSVSAENHMKPLPDLTIETISYQLQRCSGFYTAVRFVVAEELLSSEDPQEKARLQDLRSRAEKNADGLVMAAVVFLTTQESKTDAEAVKIAVDARDGMSAQYLPSFAETNSSLSTVFNNDLWANDTAACSGLVSEIVPLMQSLTGQ